jgi:hypothetical protein
MFFTVLLLVVAVGLALHWALPRMYPDGSAYSGTPISITWTEFALGVVGMMLLFQLIIGPVGTNMARGNSLKFKEYWNGYETAATHQEVPCTRDGPCRFEYDCDPYQVAIHHPATYDSKGNMTSPAYTTYETHYHACPYATVEWIDGVETTLGHYEISHGFSDHPQEWRGGHGIRGGVQIGHTPFWLAAKARIDNKDPGPVTVRKTYDNYILASQQTILKKYSGAIDSFKAKRMMPKPSTGIYSYYWGEKIYFTGMPKPPNYEDWRFTVDGLNAALGSDLQGDLHLVVVPTRKVPSPDTYSQALFAYWQSRELGREAASKNTIVVVAGVSGKTVKWVRASTGMPLGNEQMLTDLRNIRDVPFTPEAFVGKPVVGGPKVANGDGALEKVLWGEHQFSRVCMTCKDEKGKTGFQYLKGQIPLTGGQKWAIGAVSFFVSCLIWLLMSWANWNIPENLEIRLPKQWRKQ